MKVFLSYASEYDQGEGIHFERVLRRLGHEVCQLNSAAGASGRGGRLISGYPAYVSLDELIGRLGKPDLFLYIEPEGLIPRGLDQAPIPTAAIVGDVHRNLRFRRKLARFFDHVFLYQRNYAAHFTDHAPGAVHWFPYACDTEFFRDLQVERDLDIGFVGKLFGPNSERRRLLAQLASRYRINPQRYYLQEEIAGIYSRSKIVVNLPIDDDLNFRFFEALSCGALLLTKRLANGQDELFSEDVHYVAFSDERELLTKADYFLGHEPERQRIAARGHSEVIRRHDLRQTLGVLLDAATAEPKLGAPIRRSKGSAVQDLYAAAYERAGRVEALLKMAAEQHRHPLTRLKLLGSAAKSFARRGLMGW